MNFLASRKILTKTRLPKPACVLLFVLVLIRFAVFRLSETKA